MDPLLTLSTTLEMAPLVRSPFRLTHCMNEGQITPPSSPPLTSNPTTTAHNGPRLQLIRLLRRSRSIRVKITACQDKTRVAKSRPSVIEMRAPFPLLLPESPSVIDHAFPSQVSSPGTLRRMSMDYGNLRAVAQQQAAVLTPRTPLLPSPIVREPWFDYSNDKNNKKSEFGFGRSAYCDSLSDTASLNSEQILSYYCNNDEDENAGDEVEQQSRIDDEEDKDNDEYENQSTASESMPVTPTELDLEYRDTFSSDESGWLANTTSHEERLRRFKTRFYQVVQHPLSDSLGGEDEDQVVSTIPSIPSLVSF